MKNVILLTMEGYSASSKKKDNILSSVVQKILIDNPATVHAYKGFKTKVLQSFTKAKKYIFTHQEYLQKYHSIKPNLFLIGKSLGGKNIYKLYEKLQGDLHKFNKIIVFFIDTHSPVFLNPFSYVGKYKGLKIPHKWVKRNRLFLNVYQHNKYPMGCKIKSVGIEKRLRDEYITHENIIHSQYVKETIQDSLVYLST